MRNVELLEKVADAIEREPERWDQRSFRRFMECGTTYCIGGWALSLAGDQEAWYRAPTEEVAADLLGLTGDEGDFVFYNGFTHEAYDHAHKEVAEWLRAIARGEPVESAAPEWWEQRVIR